ncbi:MAG: hypothetical protein WBW61_02990 [Rhodanobacteraceae bacterium]
MLLVALVVTGFATSSALAVDLQNPVMFVTQVPVPEDYATIGTVFANQMADVQRAARGGDLWIRYPDGTLRNLTAEAGYGSSGFQGDDAIAVRDPDVNFNGTKAVFSMVIGSPTEQYQYNTYFWQLYEITGFGTGQTVHITRVANQPADSNNVEPTYGSDGSILFTSDRPRNGQPQLYPQLDEYESTPSTSGIWKLDPATGSLTLLQHAPSGAFGPFVDTFGRVIFTRWDHLQQDQQAESPDYGTFNWASEAANAATLPSVDVFPEPLAETPTTNGLRVNHFFPWQVAQDGSGEETLNHIGRHELFGYFNHSFKNDPALVDFSGVDPPRTNQNQAENWLQIAEDPTTPGRYVATDAPEFYTHAAGQILSITGPPGANAADMTVTYVTSRSTHEFYNGQPPADFTGHYRNALPLSSGQMLASWVAEPRQSANEGNRAHPIPRYNFRIYGLTEDGHGYLGADPNGALTPGIDKSVSWYDPDVLVTYDGPLWELSPVEVRARAVPPLTTESVPEAPEAEAFAEANVDVGEFQAFLAARNLGVLVSRNVTTRDAADLQQPYNLRVPGGVETIGNNGHLYDIDYMQFFQGDQVRGLGGPSHPLPGRRVLAQPLHDEPSLVFNPPPPPASPPGSVAIAPDGSVAAIVPAERAMVWQSTDAAGTPVVRERYWISVKPGEVRACSSCHGVNHDDQAGQPPAENMPQAFRDLLVYWRDHHEVVFDGGFD